MQESELNIMKKVKELCSAKKWTIADLAEAIDIHPQSLSRIISTGNTRRTTLEKIAKALEVTIPELYGDDDERVLRFLDESEWSILKIITLNIPTQYGKQDVSYFMYKRPFASNYKMTPNSEPINFFDEYPRQKDYPQDEIDNLIFFAVKEKYPDSTLFNKLILTNTDRDHVNRLMDPPTEEGKITLTPFITPDVLKSNPGTVYYRYEIPLKLYTSFLHKDYQKYFFTSFIAEHQYIIDAQHKSIIVL
ncbi:MAG: helix-turn-helix transcriptional regulator [Bacteroidales bacterium]|nr:helix-turn-helix transcriptional regulator [Bacteroidales bacterium]